MRTARLRVAGLRPWVGTLVVAQGEALVVHEPSKGGMGARRVPHVQPLVPAGALRRRRGGAFELAVAGGVVRKDQ